MARNNPRQGSCRAKQNNQDGTLTKQQRRNLPSPNDVIFSEQNVIIRNGQLKYKLKNHGHEFGIESNQNSNGRFKTTKTGKYALFRKDTNEFVSAWVFTSNQVTDLVVNGNVGYY